MHVLTPITITEAMLSAATTVAEPAAGEIAWVSAGAYVVGDLRIRSATHCVYACVQAHTGRTTPPEVDEAYWLKKAPTQRWAPFDIYTSTACVQSSGITYVLSPGFFNAVALYGAVGSSVSIAIRDAPGGSVIYSYTGLLSEPPDGWYEYLFAPLKSLSKLILRDLPLRPNAEITVTITGTTASLGMLVVGDLRPLTGAVGGTQFGASAEPVSYSYIKVDPDGTTSIVRRGSATGMRATVHMAREQADVALQAVQSVLDVPVAWIATTEPGYDGLNVFGLGSASVTYTGPSLSILNLNVKGLI